MSQPNQQDEHYNKKESRLVYKSGDMFEMLQRVYNNLTKKREMDEGFRREVADLLQNIDHVDRP